MSKNLALLLGAFAALASNVAITSPKRTDTGRRGPKVIRATTDRDASNIAELTLSRPA